MCTWDSSGVMTFRDDGLRSGAAPHEAQGPALESGTYVVEVLASDAVPANFGRAVAELLVRPAR
ncbi:MAG TPA: hypothetical protein VE974_22535 [Thermoanaerobaculia bacterium]|nr:hypothetical protein [Thermoanaerobaculia bacterium]